MELTKKEIAVTAAAQAIGPYSQAVTVKGAQEWIYVSGQLPVDPRTGIMISGGIKELTHAILDSIEGILLGANSSLRDVVRVEVFMTDLKDFAAMNEVYEARFTSKPFPARQTVQVAALPKNAPIEISCIAIKGA